MLPAHGPASGGTLVVVRGSNFDGGAPDEYSCRFGTADLGWREVPATLGPVGGVGPPAVRCETPAAPSSGALVVVLEVSSNAYDYPANSTVPFRYYAHPILDVVNPAAGPTDGATLVRVYGAHLHGGLRGLWRCRFGAAGVDVGASFDAASGALLCFTPAVAAPGPHQVQVALNVDHFSGDAPTFAYYAPPRLMSISPLSGHGNGTVVTLHGTSFGLDGGSLCRFGNALTNASALTASSVRCMAPPAARAGAWSTISLSFSEPWASQLSHPEVELRGQAMVAAGVLHLVDFDAAAVGEAPVNSIGSLVLSLPQPALPARHFRATFMLRMGRGGGADGASFSYGDLPMGPIGELGAGRGLRVSLRTFTFERVEVWYGGELLLVSPVTEGATLRSSGFEPVLVSHGPDGLTVMRSGVTHAASLPIAKWDPQPGWRFAIGARSGGESDDHHIDDLLIEAGAAFVPTLAPVGLTLNGLQFTEEDVSFEYPFSTDGEVGSDDTGAR